MSSVPCTCRRPDRLAVRSSGADEDGSEASAAGQNLTVLGCAGVPAVLTALQHCWASLLEYSSVHYRRSAATIYHLRPTSYS